jgi:hypothetical protein
MVGSPQVLESAAVLHEVRVFSSTGRKVIPIEFNGSLEEARLKETLFAQFITPDVLRIKESAAALETGPSEAALTDFENAFVFRRQSTKRMMALQIIAGALAVMLVFSIGFWRLAERRRVQADIAKNEAEVKRKEAVAQR